MYRKHKNILLFLLSVCFLLLPVFSCSAYSPTSGIEPALTAYWAHKNTAGGIAAIRNRHDINLFKGDFGERFTEFFYTKIKGYKSLALNPPGSHHHGIDNLFLDKNKNLVVVESKFGSSQLNSKTKQLSSRWVLKNLKKQANYLKVTNPQKASLLRYFSKLPNKIKRIEFRIKLLGGGNIAIMQTELIGKNARTVKNIYKGLFNSAPNPIKRAVSEAFKDSFEKSYNIKISPKFVSDFINKIGPNKLQNENLFKMAYKKFITTPQGITQLFKNSAKGAALLSAFDVAGDVFENRALFIKAYRNNGLKGLYALLRQPNIRAMVGRNTIKFAINVIVDGAHECLFAVCPEIAPVVIGTEIAVFAAKSANAAYNRRLQAHQEALEKGITSGAFNSLFFAVDAFISGKTNDNLRALSSGVFSVAELSLATGKSIALYKFNKLPWHQKLYATFKKPTSKLGTALSKWLPHAEMLSLLMFSAYDFANIKDPVDAIWNLNTASYGAVRLLSAANSLYIKKYIVKKTFFHSAYYTVCGWLHLAGPTTVFSAPLAAASVALEAAGLLLIGVEWLKGWHDEKEAKEAKEEYMNKKFKKLIEKYSTE